MTVMRLLIVSFLLLPMASHAAESMALAQPAPQEKRFFPLDVVRQAGGESSQQGLTLSKERKAFALRSDKKQMENGSMRTIHRSIRIFPRFILKAPLPSERRSAP